VSKQEKVDAAMCVFVLLKWRDTCLIILSFRTIASERIHALLADHERVRHSNADWFFNFGRAEIRLLSCQVGGLKIEVVCIVTLFAKMCIYYIACCTALSDTRTRSFRHGSALYTLVHKLGKKTLSYVGEVSNS
jgi:hypothetical protein